MRVVVRIESINRCCAKCFKSSSRELAVVDERAASRRNGVLYVLHKTIWSISACASFTWVIGCSGREDNVRALRFEEVCGVDFVRLVGQNSLRDATKCN